jgi:Ser/Thr protein kinase RdoA (MazF antagonist)
VTVDVHRFATRFGIPLTGLQVSSITIGYEDDNYLLASHGRSWVLKVFRSSRSKHEVESLVAAIVLARQLGVRHPRLTEDSEQRGVLVWIDDVGAICMDHVMGRSLFEDDVPLGVDDVDQIVDQIARLRRSPSDRQHPVDPWSFRSLGEFLPELNYVLSKEDRALFDSAMYRFGEVDESSFLVGFVHGDLVPTNILRGDELHLIDFGRCGTRPLIDEIAILVAQSFFPTDGTCPGESVSAFIEALREKSMVTNAEVLALPALVAAVNATYLFGARRLHLAANDPLNDETEYWYDRSRSSLEWALKWTVDS